MATVGGLDIRVSGAGGPPQVARRVVRLSVSPTHRPHHGLTVGGAFTLRYAEFGDHTLLARRAYHTGARIHTCE